VGRSEPGEAPVVLSQNSGWYDQQWQCAICQQWQVVLSLARECEETHKDEAPTLVA
jgi:hypothetical protein